jgi:hypothetical protein
MVLDVNGRQAVLDSTAMAVSASRLPSGIDLEPDQHRTVCGSSPWLRS